MLIKRILYLSLLLGSLAASSISLAAELRGQLSGKLPNASIIVFCSGQQVGASTIDASGKYAVRGLPASRDCSFKVSSGNKRSAAIPFSTSRSVTVYSGKLLAHGQKIVVLRK